MHLVAVELAVRRGAEVILHVARAFDVVGRSRAALELMEDRAMRLGHDLREHVEAPAMRHTEHDFLYAEIAAALDDLFECRDERLGPVEAEPLGAGELDVAEFLEAFRLDQLVEDRALALARERDLLVLALDALLDPGLLLRVRDVHELDAERLAVGALQDRDDLAHGGEFEPEHVIEEDLALEIGVAEAVGAGIELVVVHARLETERIELGVEMAADAVGTDQHQRVDRVARGLLYIDGGQFDACALRLRPDLLAELLLGVGPLAVERGEKLVTLDRRRLFPGGAARAPGDVRGLVLQAREETAARGIDRIRIGLVAGIEVLDVGGVTAVEKGRACESRVRVLA